MSFTCGTARPSQFKSVLPPPSPPLSSSQAAQDALLGQFSYSLQPAASLDRTFHPHSPRLRSGKLCKLSVRTFVAFTNRSLFLGILVHKQCPMSILIVSAEIQHTHIPEAKFLDVFGEKSLQSFPPWYSQSPLLTNFTPTNPLEQKWFETGL
jgi:hypothetical protein